MAQGHFYSIIITYPVEVKAEDFTVTFGSEGNYKDSAIDFSGIQIGDNGGNNSQVKNGSFSFEVLAVHSHIAGFSKSERTVLHAIPSLNADDPASIDAPIGISLVVRHKRGFHLYLHVVRRPGQSVRILQRNHGIGCA